MLEGDPMGNSRGEHLSQDQQVERLESISSPPAGGDLKHDEALPHQSLGGPAVTAASPEVPEVPQSVAVTPVTEKATSGFKHWQEVIAGLAGVLGAVIGGVIAFAATQSSVDRQVSASAHQSTVEFYRTQKQEAYSRLIADSTAITRPITDATYDFAYSADPSAPDVLSKRLDLHRLIGLVRNDFSTIQLVGSNEVIDAAKDLWLANGARILALEDQYDKWRREVLTAEQRKQTVEVLTPDIAKAEQAQQQFIELARNDLDTTS